MLAMPSEISLALASPTEDNLWHGSGASGKGHHADVFIVDVIVWSDHPDFEVRHIRTCEVLKNTELLSLLKFFHHKLFYNYIGTANFMITGERGNEFLGFYEDFHNHQNWFNGSCITGMVLVNGFFLRSSLPVFCYPALRLDGFFALSYGS